MVIDHVAVLVPDAAAAAHALRVEHGLGSERGPYLPFAGTRAFTVPLAPPTYLEILSIEDRAAAETSESGRDVLACEAAGFGLLAWAVLVDDLEAQARRLGREIFDYTVSHGDGTLRGWRSVALQEEGWRSSVPFFIDYPNNGNRLERWQAMSNDLPLRFVPGDGGLVEARIATAAGEVVLH